jgi:hypothetical protein
LDIHVTEHGVVVSILHVWRVPVDEAACPLNSSFSVGLKSSGPQGQHHASRSLRVVVAVGCGIPCLVAVLCSHDGTVDDPAKRIGCPVYCVGVGGRFGV